MAFSSKSFLIFTLFTLLSSPHTYARDAQLFNKVPNKNVVPDHINEQQQQQPDFLLDNENSYGLESQQTDQLPPSTTTQSNQLPHNNLPKNYNSVSYVTQHDDLSNNTPFRQESSFNTNPETQTDSLSDNPSFGQQDSFTTYPGNSNYYNDQQQEPGYRSRRNNNNYYYGGGSSFNSQPQGMATPEYDRRNYFNTFEGDNFQPQGMSDTRSLENGKYFYDINSKKYNNNHPYERLRNSAYTNVEDANSMGGYRDHNEFQDENTYNMP